ncbi:proline dehydrogenase family protein [Flavobacteriales bacterium]|nr:proline dehydrogenase family protein [Flavobacteriales bacterium]
MSKSKMSKISFDNTEIAFKAKSTSDLQKSYWLFKLVSNNVLVKLGPALLKIAFLLRLPIKSIIKNTIFEQFCGGESIKDCEERIQSLAKYNIQTILDYSVEGESSKENFDLTANEIIKTIKRAKGDENIPFAVFKTSGLARIELLEKVSSNISLNENEKREFELLKDRVKVICQKAYDLDVRIFIDAEESWIQNAIDDLATSMMRKFNSEKAIVYNTLQMYRWDRIAFLKQSYADAENGNYYLGLKIVRGAYMEKERELAEERGYSSPIQKDKISCDKDYDLALAYCISHIDKIALCAGTHNEESSLKLIDLMRENNILKDDKRVYFSQLLGMSDHISFNLANGGYNVVKYMPYGPVKLVMPYLIRRAQENTSISGQTGRELNLIIKEKTRRTI